VQQNIRSAAQYSRTFENGINSSVSFQNDQNIVTNEYTGSFPLAVTIPQKRFVKSLFDVPRNK
jgi:hypothetical protein